MTVAANGVLSEIRGAVEEAILPADRVVLAVSGGRDSMVLLDAVARWRGASIAAVATFDHGTGPAATSAVAMVRAAAGSRGLPFIEGRAAGLDPTEAAWRAARWAFLRTAAGEDGARIASGHTRDDQLETVFIRALRDSGPRGLAGLYAETDIVRPLLGVSRHAVAEYAAARGVTFIDDPSNLSRAYLRNRVRLDLLPAFERAHPGFGEELLGLSARAAAWRAGVERHVDALNPRREGPSVFIDACELVALEETARAHMWPAVAARAGIALDRKGTERLAAFSTHQGRRGRVQLAGGHEVVRHAHTFEIRPAPFSGQA